MPGDRVSSTLLTLCAKWRSPERVPRVKLMLIRSRKRLRCWRYFQNPPQRLSRWRRSRVPRKGEIRGFLWEGYDGYTIEVKQSVWRNHVGEPKREKSKGTIPVIAQLKLFLDRHRAHSGHPSRGYIFQNPCGKPLNLDALATEVIRPALGAEKIPWHGWHAFRRGLATNLHRLGVSDKVIQQILRHADVTTTINIYVKTVTQDAEDAMKKLETKCSTVVPQPRLTGARFEPKTQTITVQQTSPLDAVRENLAERGGFEPPVHVLARTTV
jgi:Phage integrase family